MARFIPLGLHRGGFARSSVPVRRQRLTSECSVDAPRDVVFLPLLLLLPGHGSFGSLKGRVLFAGVEYLENEPSSLTADLTGRQPAGAGLGQDHFSAHGRAGARALRRPDLGSRTGAMRPVRLTRPPLRHRGARARAAGTWGRRPQLHRRRTVAARASQIGLAGSRPVRASATIIGGKAASVVPAVMQYVALKGLPQRPPTLNLPDYIRLARLSNRATTSATRPVSPSAPIRPPMPPG